MNHGSVSDSKVTSVPRRERDRLLRRKDILHAAEQVFGEKGFHAASIEEIAKAAEYATGTIYLYFKDKDTLYRDLFEQKIQELFDFIRARIGDEKDPIAALKRLIHARMEFFQQNRAFFQVYWRERLDLRNDGPTGKWGCVFRTYEQYIGLLTQLMKAGQRKGLIRKGDPRDLAIALSGMMIQLTRDWMRREGERELIGEADFVAELFLQGAQQPK